MEYVYILLAIVAALIWVGKQIANFFRWVARSVSGATPTRPVPTAAGRPATPPAGARPNPPRRAALTSERPPEAPAAPTREAASFAPAPPSPAAPLLGSRDDLARAIILIQALGPPVSRRRRPPPPA